MTLLGLVLGEQVHHAELQRCTLILLHVIHNLEHVVDGCRHDKRVLLPHHHAEQLSEMRGWNLTHQIVVVDGQQQGITAQVVTGGDQTLRHLVHKLVVERETAITLTV